MKKITLICVCLFLLGLLTARWWAEPLLVDVNYSQLVLDRSGNILRLTLSGEEKYRLKVRLDEVSPQFIEALLLLEDKYFYFHPGFNPYSLVHAALSTYGHGIRVGGSTLTMQVARLKYGLSTKSIRGKIKQIFYALKMELFHNKREILEAYLNLAPYGANIEGIGSASLIYYEKQPKQLSISESLTLALLPQNPSARVFSPDYRPYKSLMSRWLDAHPQDRKNGITLNTPAIAKKISEIPFRAPHFAQHMLAHYPERPILRTTLDLQVQGNWEKRIHNYLKTQSALGVRNASAVLINYETMQIEAYIGSASFFDEEIEGQVDGVLARRSPGSTMKPLVYALALDQGLIHAHSILKDTPSSFGAYDPENFDGQYVGPVDATTALVQSRNVPAVYLSSRLENPTLYEFLKTNKIDLPRSSHYYGLSIVLGGAEVSLLDLAQLYSILARHGERLSISSLIDEKVGPSTKSLSPEAAFVTLEMLTKNPPPRQNFPRQWLRKNFPVAWKTGTSRAFRDAWSMAVFGPYVAGVWIGNFNNEANQSFVGRDMAAPLLFELIDTLEKSEFPNPRFQNHLGLNIKKVSVCSLSGHIPGPDCPATEPAWFIPGRSPIKPCNVHRQIFVSKTTGKRLCHPQSGSAVPKIFEFWSSDFLQLVRQAGLTRKTPPNFDDSCSDEERLSAGLPPQIVSPRSQVTYQLSISASEELNSIPLRAITDADAQKVHWYAGNRYLGNTPPERPLFWKAEPGDYIIRAVDNLGRSDTRKLSVRTVQ